MSDEYRIIYLKDTDEKNISGYFHTIKEKNPKLYDSIMENLRKENSIGIRGDILKYISGHIEDFKTDQQYVFHIASLICNLKITADYLEWVNIYFRDVNKIKISEFMIVFNEAVEKDIPLETIKRFFSEDADELKIYQKVVDYHGEDTNTDIDEEKQREKNTEHYRSEKETESNQEMRGQMSETLAEQTDHVDNGQENYGMTSMFDNLLTVMTLRNKEDSVIDAQNKLNEIIAKFQLVSTEMTTCFTGFIREWEKDKEEIERLTALNEIQQKILGTQQTKINELRNEIMYLNEKIRTAERAALHQEAIKQKISELDTLTSGYSSTFGR